MHPSDSGAHDLRVHQYIVGYSTLASYTASGCADQSSDSGWSIEDVEKIGDGGLCAVIDIRVAVGHFRQSPGLGDALFK